MFIVEGVGITDYKFAFRDDAFKDATRFELIPSLIVLTVRHICYILQKAAKIFSCGIFPEVCGQMRNKEAKSVFKKDGFRFAVRKDFFSS